MTNIPRNEHPRPDFCRSNWLSLNGEWEFSFEEQTFDRTILVPFACESSRSGIGDKGFHHTVWYRRTFRIPESMRGKRIMLHFNAVDYCCRVWVNGGFVTGHAGGQTGFFADITQAVREDADNTVTVKAVDDPLDLEMPRGKQFWEEDARSIFYSRTTGIWQSVWIEAVSSTHLQAVQITPLFDDKAVKFDYALCENVDAALETLICFNGVCVTRLTLQSQSRKGSYTVSLDQPALKAWNFYEDLTWSPENPRLFEATFRVYCGGRLEDEVASYFGMRKVSTENGVFQLNNRPYYQKLVLDQGYWKDSLLTAPDDEAFVKDIELIKAMGFNGVRKHQKIEDPRFLYHADRLGLLVWGEIGSAYLYSREYAVRMYREWTDAVLRDYNHPCIVVWTPLNESWGVQEIKTNRLQQAHCSALYHMIKSLDDTRVVVDNDGWEHIGGDMLTIHDYESSPAVLEKRYSRTASILEFSPGGRYLYANGSKYAGQPILVTEFGGIKFAGNDETRSWGYSEAATAEEFVEKLRGIIAAVQGSPAVQGYCYTQLADIEREENGLLTFDRRPKAPPEVIKAINDDKKS